MNDNYLNDSDFLLVIFEIFVDLLLIISIIYQRKYELINNLKFILKIVLNWYEKLDLTSRYLLEKIYNFLKNIFQNPIHYKLKILDHNI